MIFYRTIIKILFSKTNEFSVKANNILIYGAGGNGVLAKRAFYNNQDYNILGFIDDDKYKTGKTIEAIPIFKLGKKLDNFISKYNISKIIISTEKLSSNRRKYIFNYFQNLKIQVLLLPPVETWINGLPDINKLKEINIDELLSRGEIIINNNQNLKNYKGKTILVTGAAGSIGSEIVRQLHKFKPKKLILIDHAETPMFSIKNEFDVLFKNIDVEYHIESINDDFSMEIIFSSNKIDFVFHAAAYKHVTMMEVNPRSAILNNVYGTKLIVDLSVKYNVNKFVLISSDKAVNPTNVMGASKRICELYLASYLSNSDITTKLITTRFGNVLGSNGSVIPIFENQIKNGGPLTITHPNIVRYFMLIREACQLVLEAGTMGKEGEVFVFDMGEPIKILDLANNMITQKGLKLGIDIDIEFTGLRPGEKLYEELLVGSEDLIETYNELIYISKKHDIDYELKNNINFLIDLAFNSSDKYEIVKQMKKIVPEFISNQSEFQKLDKNV